jgi:hypothetical protein
MITNSLMVSESYCFLDNTQHGGTALTGFPLIGSATHCQFECQKYEGCQFFSYNNTNGYCALYSASTTYVFASQTSGPKFCISKDSNMRYYLF